MRDAELILFAGTTGGRRLAEELSDMGARVLICVATEYARELVERGPNLQVLSGRMDSADMVDLLEQTGCGLVVDATHPYAKEVTANVKTACAFAEVEYIRLVRDSYDGRDVTTAASPVDAAAILSRVGGKALLTVGSKELSAFTKVNDYQHQLFPRILPMQESLDACMSLGFPGQQIIAMQGPFSHELNVALLRQIGAGWLVTKDSGEAGGFPEKLSAAKEVGARVLLIRRPSQEEGFTYSQARRHLMERMGLWHTSERTSGQSPRFPLFISLVGRTVFLAGGGAVAARRTGTLLACGARVVVVAPEAAAELEDLAIEGEITLYSRTYTPGDLELMGAVLAMAATDDPAVNRQVAEEAERLGIPCSVADDPAGGSFWFPAFVRRDNLVAGIVSVDGDYAAVRRAAELFRRCLDEGGAKI